MNIKVDSFALNYPLDTIVDSMLYPTSTDIAVLKGHYEKDDKTYKIIVKLVVSGNAAITYKGNTYTRPENYSEELVSLIRNNPFEWIKDDNIHINEMNSFVLGFVDENTENANRLQAKVFSDVLIKMTSGELREKMIKFAEENLTTII